MDRPAKRLRMLSDDSGSDSEGQEDISMIKINDEYAKRFQHNKTREERQKLEEKYGSAAALDSEEDSDSESEDDVGELATQELDEEIFETLNAIKSRDSRVYDKHSTFYKPLAQNPNTDRPPKEKSMNLQDYHRKNLLEGGPDVMAEEAVPKSYDAEQEAIKRNLLDQVQRVEMGYDEDESELEDAGFLVKKLVQNQEPDNKAAKPAVDVTIADRDPETYLSNFMAARAWVPLGNSQLQPFESEDEDEEDRADAFEQAYNLRFEDPKHANEKLMSHSRDLAMKYSVRREEPTGRKKGRELEKTKKDAEKREREEDKARYRRLKIEEAQEKLYKFKEVAGLGQQVVPIEEWSQFLDAGWDSERWDREMSKRFGDHYYEDEDQGDDLKTGDGRDTAEAQGKGLERKQKKTVKRPKWDDDIDIGDIVPDFNEEEERAKNTLVLSDNDDADSDGGVDLSEAGEAGTTPTAKSLKSKAKDAEKLRMEQKRQARKERQKIEELVDQSLGTDLAIPGTSQQQSRFRYRETSPSTFGLSARDILMADDSQLNQFAGLKKLATFRDDEKKRKDKKKLGKKARLRQWRKETFGDEEGPKTSFEEFINSQRAASGFVPARPDNINGTAGSGNVLSEKKKKKRSRKRKAAEVGS